MSVLVFTENWDGKFKKLSFELVSYASKVAEMLNTQTVALSIGNVEEEELKKLGNYGAGKVVSVQEDQLNVLDNQAYTSVIAQVAEKEEAQVIVIAHNNTGKALAPRLSVRLKAGLGSAVAKLPASTEPFTIHKKVFSGKAFAQMVIKSDCKIVTLAQNSFELIENPKDVTLEQFDARIGEVHTTVKDVQKQAGQLLLTDAEIVVSGGRGMKSAENWQPLVELAEALGGATACSRPVSDEGWRPHEEHTGQTGKIIAPNLYVAVGISGAIQHLAGVSGSKCLVALNNDKDAPIFEAADYGIVGDALKVLPEFIAAVKEAKAK
ncbi:MAG: electron transfer flavoprotein subunit alpha/FixB family protein [Bacteroidales bacterium]|jgi:electron transfer flavoprotein alpha subunit|nr:electron transfer flavoprotein subunit alpha/FixB family protein [Bacteroidales bacterium]